MNTFASGPSPEGTQKVLEYYNDISKIAYSFIKFGKTI